MELRVFFKEDLHPFYPPSFALIRPRLQGRRSVRGDEIKKEREDRAVWSVAPVSWMVIWHNGVCVLLK